MMSRPLTAVQIRPEAAEVASHLLVNIRVSLNDGVAPGVVPLNRSVHHAHAKADIEHIAVTSSSRADGLQHRECSVQRQGGQASAGSSSTLKRRALAYQGCAEGQRQKRAAY